VPTSRRTHGPRAPGRPPKHGARALARLLSSNALDKRTGIARDFYAVQDALAEDRGGWEHTSNGERIVFEVIANEVVILRSLFSWAATQPSIVVDTAEGPRLLGPLQKGFTSHAGSLVRALALLGVKPDKVDRLPRLEDYLAQKTAEAEAAAACGASGTAGEAEARAIGVADADAAAAAQPTPFRTDPRGEPHGGLTHFPEEISKLQDETS
jgi:hypothetical protein